MLIDAASTNGTFVNDERITSRVLQPGDRVRFGMHVAVEPYLKIGSDSVVASGITLTSHVAERTIVKAHAQYTAKPL